MSKISKKTAQRGRPKLDKTMKQISVRLEADLLEAIEEYRLGQGLDDASATIRHILRHELRRLGILAIPRSELKMGRGLAGLLGLKVKDDAPPK